jgi:hypothetical protein
MARQTAQSAKPASADATPICGIVMPISATADYSEAHWRDVRRIITRAAFKAGFAAHLVSEARESGVIHSRIVQSLHDNPMVVCDVSSRNANAIFELGIRLTFDRPTIIIKDDVTPFSFDHNPVDHLIYPRDLRYHVVQRFIRDLADKITATHNKARSDPNYSTFLKHFGKFKVPGLETRDIPADEFVRAIQNTIETLNTKISELRHRRHPIDEARSELDRMSSTLRMLRRTLKIDPTLRFEELPRETQESILLAFHATLGDRRHPIIEAAWDRIRQQQTRETP